MPAVTLGNIAGALDAEFITKSVDTRLSVATALASDLMSDVLAFSNPGSILLTSLASPQAVRTAEVADIHAICFVLGKKPSEDAVRLAEDNSIPLMTTRHSLLSASGILYNMGLVGSEPGGSGEK